MLLGVHFSSKGFFQFFLLWLEVSRVDYRMSIRNHLEDSDKVHVESAVFSCR